MNIIKTEIPEVIIFEPKVFNDTRGYFFESFRESTFIDIIGYNAKLVQANESFSTYGVLRGLHFQKGEHAQGKLVRVIQGEIFDVAVDIRPNSPTFGKHASALLSGDNKRQIWVPRGFAHGFVVLSETVILAYQCDNYYNKESEGGILYNDPALGIKWPVPDDKILLSDKDSILPLLKDI